MDQVFHKAFEEVWEKQQEAVKRLGWVALTEREKSAAYWGWKMALDYTKKEGNSHA